MRTRPGCVASLALALALPTAAHGAGGPIYPGPHFGGLGVMGEPQTPAGEFRYVAGYGGRRETALAKISARNGRVADWRFFDRPWAVPAVTLKNNSGGLSGDGETLLLTDGAYRPRARQSPFLILETRRLAIERKLVLKGNYSFDAISPDGNLLYLVEYEDLQKDPRDYRVRVYDLEQGDFRPGEVVDPDEPGERMAGYPMDRVTSPDGRWAFTLYAGGDEAFIHALDTVDATAVCIDLPMVGDGAIWRKRLRVETPGGPIEVLGDRRVVAVVDQETFEVSEPPAVARTAAAPVAGEPSEAGGGRAWLLVTLGAGVALLAIIGFARGRSRRTIARCDGRS
jgi:hypothetical protein